ncbi:CHAP domain-containing protein, partial [Actinomadura adrarensis]
AEGGSAVPAPAPAAEPEQAKPTVKEMLDLAQEQVGISEDSGGETKFQEWYVGSDRAEETVARDGGGSPRVYSSAAWCSMFISWLGDQTGFTDQVGSDAWTVEHARWFKEEGRWGTKPKPGAIVFFAWNGSKNISSIKHVGIVVEDKGDGQVATIEGNSRNAVREQVRSAGDIVGYGYPEYADEK